jgi:hypothetical protein
LRHLVDGFPIICGVGNAKREGEFIALYQLIEEIMAD